MFPGHRAGFLNSEHKIAQRKQETLKSIPFSIAGMGGFLEWKQKEAEETCGFLQCFLKGVDDGHCRG